MHGNLVLIINPDKGRVLTGFCQCDISILTVPPEFNYKPLPFPIINNCFSCKYTHVKGLNVILSPVIILHVGLETF